MNTEIQ